MISEKALKDFKILWKKHFGEDISDEKAMEEAINFLNLFNVIYRPITQQWANDYDNGKHRRNSKQ